MSCFGMYCCMFVILETCSRFPSQVQISIILRRLSLCKFISSDIWTTHVIHSCILFVSCNNSISIFLFETCRSSACFIRVLHRCLEFLFFYYFILLVVVVLRSLVLMPSKIFVLTIAIIVIFVFQIDAIDGIYYCYSFLCAFRQSQNTWDIEVLIDFKNSTALQKHFGTSSGWIAISLFKLGLGCCFWCHSHLGF
jgi:hypothetical protein